jgi:rubrerythrin
MEVSYMAEHDEVITTGEKALGGKYYCDKCGYEYDHKDESEPMPNCPDEDIYTIWNTTKMKQRFVESA